MKNLFKDKKILITGATGSIGKSVLLRLLKTKCKVIRAMSNDENSLFELSELVKKNSYTNLDKYMRSNRIRYIQGDVSDINRCISASEDIDIIIHAAAMKHVPFCEYNPLEATKVNVVGTENMVTAALKNNISKFIMVSTDKVVNPTSVLGATKLLAERIVVNANLNKGRKKTTFSCVRFGNVIGTRGSILPFFISQAKSSNKITVTTNNMTRYFMTINHAVDVILYAITNMSGGEIFIPNNLKKFKIRDLAEVIKKRTKKNIKIALIGRRDGEKEHESLFTDIERENIKVLGNYYIICNKPNKKKFFPKNEKNISKKEIEYSLKTYFDDIDL